MEWFNHAVDWCSHLVQANWPIIAGVAAVGLLIWGVYVLLDETS